MKVYAINGSPRKNNNTATLLQKALDGVKEAAKDKEIETEIINLYDLNYTGCKSCFACKRLGGASYGKCAIKDDIYEVLEKLSQADGIIFGSPIYLSNITGQLQSFLERLLFPYLVYDENYSTIAPKKMPTAFIYTMNAQEELMDKIGYPSTFNKIESSLERILTKPLVMYSNNTYQFDDYSKYKSNAFSEEEKAEHRRTQFPLDCQKAFELGTNLIK
ncbi:flavodoxin family protein [Clostridium estertheticum]|uniref:Flavodoxin family protein n=1 Tax=Clostridium estertheticum TaxID=238834 RepID=A0A7Y3WU15_9CLOT|nr:flavodoxin family protein [Clostridium estertheticum]MBU3071949.1 flavodoxin family protein [Clostridium estertheticum]MBU3162041.1 flavodoxin family protein [Clostridium estertheticum]NNU77550.1 flavodoxin family protein [Clostridium estertheticum]WBL48509.1 flavodoxin family protein [Clostridium estertheticum]